MEKQRLGPACESCDAPTTKRIMRYGVPHFQCAACGLIFDSALDRKTVRQISPARPNVFSMRPDIFRVYRSDLFRLNASTIRARHYDKLPENRIDNRLNRCWGEREPWGDGYFPAKRTDHIWARQAIKLAA